MSGRRKPKAEPSKLAKVIQPHPANNQRVGRVTTELNERGVLQIRVATAGHNPGGELLLAACLCGASAEGLAGLEAALAAARAHVLAAEDAWCDG